VYLIFSGKNISLRPVFIRYPLEKV